MPEWRPSLPAWRASAPADHPREARRYGTRSPRGSGFLLPRWWLRLRPSPADLERRRSIQSRFSQIPPRIPLLQTCLFENAVERSFVHLLRRMSGNCNASQFRRMLELSMAALLRHLVPTVILDQLQNVANFHACPNYEADYILRAVVCALP